MSLAEMADERGLSRTGFALDEDEPSVTRERELVSGLEPVEERLALEQAALPLESVLHGYILLRLSPILNLCGRYDRRDGGAKGVC